MTINPYVPIVGLLILGALFALFSVAIAPVVGPKRYNRAKLDAYECGIEPAPQPIGGGRFPVKFYLTAMLFIVFDIEIIFLYPWAVNVRVTRRVRVRGDGPVHRHRVHRLHIRVATRRPGLGLIAMGIEEKLPTDRHPADLGGEAVQLGPQVVVLAEPPSGWPAARSR